MGNLKQLSIVSAPEHPIPTFLHSSEVSNLSRSPTIDWAGVRGDYSIWKKHELDWSGVADNRDAIVIGKRAHELILRYISVLAVSNVSSSSWYAT